MAAREEITCTAEHHVRLRAGYGEPGFLASYLGVQAHGILWPAPGATASANWPIAPPMVSAKVRSRAVCITCLK